MRAHVTNRSGAARGFQSLDRGTVMVEPGASRRTRPRRPRAPSRLARGRRGQDRADRRHRASFSPCGRRWREAPDEGFWPVTSPLIRPVGPLRGPDTFSRKGRRGEPSENASARGNRWPWREALDCALFPRVDNGHARRPERRGVAGSRPRSHAQPLSRQSGASAKPIACPPRACSSDDSSRKFGPPLCRKRECAGPKSRSQRTASRQHPGRSCVARAAGFWTPTSEFRKAGGSQIQRVGSLQVQPRLHGRMCSRPHGLRYDIRVENDHSKRGRLGWRRVSGAVQFQPAPAFTKGCEFRPDPNPRRRRHRCFQDVLDLGFRAPPVLFGAQLQGAKNLVRKIADRDGGHPHCSELTH